MENIITVEHVTKRFGQATVLNDINVSFEKGKIHGLIGRNGSGKTVLMKCICGFVPVTEGKIIVNGKQIGKDIDVPDNIGAIIETPGFIPHYSGYKNLKVLAELNGKIDRGQIIHTMELVGLNPNLRRPIKKYSLGMRQRLGIAQAIMEEPNLLVLDEPFNGLDAEGVLQMRKLLLGKKALGTTILLSSHNAEDIETLCDTVSKMEQGKVLRNA